MGEEKKIFYQTARCLTAKIFLSKTILASSHSEEIQPSSRYSGTSCEFSGFVLLEKYFRAELKLKKFFFFKWANSTEFFCKWANFTNFFLQTSQFYHFLQEKAVNSSSKASNVWPDEINKGINNRITENKSW